MRFPSMDHHFTIFGFDGNLMGYHSMKSLKWYGRAVELKNIVRVSSHGTVWAASNIIDIGCGVGMVAGACTRDGG